MHPVKPSVFKEYQRATQDTANAYVNEKAVGRAIKKSGIDCKQIFLETKLWPSFYEQEDAVGKTLERLDTLSNEAGHTGLIMELPPACSELVRMVHLKLQSVQACR